MLRLEFSAAADIDVEEILIDGIVHFGEARARAYLEDLRGACDMLRQFPRLGRLIPNSNGTLRAHAHGAHVVLYKPTALNLTIVRLVHGRSDWNRLLDIAPDASFN